MKPLKFTEIYTIKMYIEIENLKYFRISIIPHLEKKIILVDCHFLLLNDFSIRKRREISS